MILRGAIRHLFLFLSTVSLATGLGSSFVTLSGIGSGCSTSTVSGASAPPVSLPAPVTGRLTISSPDETGEILVVGDNEAVPANSVIHVFDASQETQDTTALRLIDGLAGLIPSAEAQSGFPEVCGKPFHACALADENGAFEVTLQAAEDHELIVEILNSVGQRISDRLSKTVPKNVRHFARHVANVGLLLDTATDSYKLYALMPRTSDDPKGLVSVVDLPTGDRTPVSFDGPLPRRMAVDGTVHEAALVDPEGGFVAKVDLDANNFDAPSKLNLSDLTDVVLSTDGMLAHLATSELTDGGSADNARFIRIINFATFTDIDVAIKIASVQAFIPGITNVETRSLDLVRYFGSVVDFDLVAFTGMYDVAGTPTAVVGLFEATTLAVLNAVALPAGSSPQDVAFAKDGGRLLVSDAGADKIVLCDYTIHEGLVITADLGCGAEVSDPNGVIRNPRDMSVRPDGSFAFVNAGNGTAELPDTVLTVDLTAGAQVVDLNPVGFGPSGSAYNSLTQVLYVSTFKSRAVTFWGLPDLLP